MQNLHLVILIHGLWGNTTHFNYIKDQLDATGSARNEQLVIHITGSHEYYKTYDGIDVCGQRVADEIQQAIRDAESGARRVAKISIVGYSLGGLIARYAIGILYYHKVFDPTGTRGIKPMNFITFCSPHVGVLTPSSTIAVKVFNNLVPFLLANSGKQMFLKDSLAENFNVVHQKDLSVHVNDSLEGGDIPLLVGMIKPHSIFYRALKMFKNRALYANVVNDKRASWFTSGISRSDPFQSMTVGSKLLVSYVKGYENVVVDIKKGYSTKMIDPAGADGSLMDEESLGSIAQVQNFLLRKWLWCIAFANITVFAPIWVVWFIASSILQRTKSHSRLKCFLLDTSEGFLRYYELLPEDSSVLLDRRPRSYGSTGEGDSLRDKRLVENTVRHMEDRADEVMDSVWGAMMTSKVSQEDDTEQYVSLYEDTVTQLLIEETALLETPEEKYNLPVSSYQSFIIDQLNMLNWQKFPVNIRATVTSHAAAIVRHKDPNFHEGKVVVKHFVLDVFQF
ncbi:hypothetical protein BABINDRAFT_15133 [Babjeviella inositovora NRRL Y-12698]|uniref:DUF676 domain-containing protein n=1 Tax=Babjeviella inositovora NRRL Y-12698 TaxID=984486 RepID=A0A1E3QJC3_9ASCO|nr:uncharacterized protein BABINDRAFT_15133 [Babjeviella inositovora NRRL Y-12698]ODQ77779.1 hypothetical protein BABINDRAFT_15133 [Babjeviella inositovora NRRL Y-12698]